MTDAIEGTDVLNLPEGDEFQRQIQVTVSGNWEIPRKGHGGADGQFLNLPDASDWVKTQKFDEAVLTYAGRRANLAIVDDVKCWVFEDTGESMPV